MNIKFKGVIISLIILIFYIFILLKPHTFVEFVIYTCLFGIGQGFNFTIHIDRFNKER